MFSRALPYSTKDFTGGIQAAAATNQAMRAGSGARLELGLSELNSENLATIKDTEHWRSDRRQKLRDERLIPALCEF
jgi:hypothetical protein